jgi:hypothetical protein
MPASNWRQHTGLGGTPIDVEQMVDDSPTTPAVGYASRPWEDDAFVCGQLADAYWDYFSGQELRTLPADECSAHYELANHTGYYLSHVGGVIAGQSDSTGGSN